MIKALIIDDENLARENIRILLKSLNSEINIIAEAANVLDAIRKYNQEKPNVVFLDINMPNGNGFDFLECVDFTNTKVIFVTAHDDYAIKAIKYSVYDYLVKPIDIDVLQNTLSRLEKDFTAKPNTSNLQTDDKISFSTADEIINLKQENILYCTSDNSYCTIYPKLQESIIISSSLQKVQDRLNQNFFRCHQSYLINKKEIVKYLKLENKILLTNGDKIPVSKTHKKELLDHFQQT